MRGCLFLLLGTVLAWSQTPDAKEIVRRSVAANEADWRALPLFVHNETDVAMKDGKRTTKTYEQSMIDGSPYQRLIAINGQPLPADQQKQEEEKLHREIARREHESSSARKARIAKYKEERASDHLLMTQLVNAFNFQLAGQETVNGHPCWVLDASPKPDYQPVNSDAKVLTGMKGRMWIDKTGYHWVRVSAEVTKPVTMHHIANVRPGTEFTFEQSPVAGGQYWLPVHFVQSVNAKVLGMFNYGSRDEEYYSHYRRAPQLTASR